MALSSNLGSLALPAWSALLGALALAGPPATGATPPPGRPQEPAEQVPSAEPQPAPAAPLPVPTPEELDAELGELLPPVAPKAETSVDLRERDYFAICDHDRNGWISYREARISLGIRRDEYALYDRDRDGRVQTSEFHDRYVFTVERTGGFQPPVPPPISAPPERRSAEQLRNVYDRNNDLALDLEELALLLEEYRIEDLTAEELLALHDSNGTGKLETLLDEEARSLERWLESQIGDRFWNLPLVTAKTVEELFGQVVQRQVTFGGVALPPQIVGPVSHFRRLDLDGDGFISVQDLATLQAPLQLGVRASTVIASLDLDGDGRLSETEFLRSMQVSLR